MRENFDRTLPSRRPLSVEVAKVDGERSAEPREIFEPHLSASKPPRRRPCQVLIFTQTAAEKSD